ncbi:PadR family transcriptional regulator [Actinocrispum sp. NPDC049592]|uniref:PadR family transcriptional regulator n=1 Tax=Actinocrispum sp. NPDC049592 TaxID=3154835 RepID=UPI003449308C
MTLRYALLALIEAGPMTGYELAKWFDQSVAYVWHAQHSQIYTELRRLEAEGMIEAETLPRGEKATKRAYALTPAGCKQLQQWVSQVEAPPALRDPAYVKATYFEYGSYREARAQFRAHRKHYEALRDHYEEHVEQLEQRATALLKRRLAKSPASSHDAIVAYKAHAYRGLIERAKSEIAWAERGLELVDRLAAGQGVDEPVLDPSP